MGIPVICFTCRLSYAQLHPWETAFVLIAYLLGICLWVWLYKRTKHKGKMAFFTFVLYLVFGVWLNYEAFKERPAIVDVVKLQELSEQVQNAKAEFQRGESSNNQETK